MKPTRILTAGLLGLAVLALAFSTADRSAAHNAPVQADLFREKIVIAYLDDPLKGSGQYLKDARLENIGDRWVLLGTAVSIGQAGEWDEGLTAGVSWKDVTAFYLCTPAQFDEKIKNADF